MDATVTMLFSDEPTEKIKRRIFWTIQLSTRTTKPCSFIDLGSSHCVSLLTYETCGKYNDGALPRVKITRLTTIGMSKYISNLDVSSAPSEVDLSRADFLEYYNNFSESFLYASVSEPCRAPMKIYMPCSDPHFWMWLEAYKHFDKDHRVMLSKDPFIPHASSRNWSDGVQTGKDNYLLMQQEAQTYGEGRWRRARSAWGSFAGKSSIPPAIRGIFSYPFLSTLMPQMWSTCALPPLPANKAVPVSSNGKTIPSSASDQRYICLHFDLNGCKAGPTMRHGPHCVCSLYADPHHGASNAVVIEAHKVGTPYNTKGWERTLKRHNFYSTSTLIFESFST